MPELCHPGSTRAFRRPTLRARMTLLYGAVICASGVALLGITTLLAPGLFQHEVQKAGGPGQPGLGTFAAGHPTRIPIGSELFWADVVTLVIMAAISLAVRWTITAPFLPPPLAVLATPKGKTPS